MKNSNVQSVRNSSPNPHGQAPRSRGRKWTVGIVVILLSTLVFGLAAWTRAQSANPRAPVELPSQAEDREPPMTPERELSLRAILQPIEFEAEIAKRKNQEETLEEQIAILAISQPAFYAAEFEAFKGQARRNKEIAARAAILDPVSHSGSVELLRNQLKDKIERGETIEDPILNPTLESGNIPGAPLKKAPRALAKPVVEN